MTRVEFREKGLVITQFGLIIEELTLYDFSSKAYSYMMEF